MTDSIQSISLLDYSIYTGDLKDLFSRNKMLINTINQYSLCIAEKDPEFKKSLQEADILLPDGMAIVAAVKLLKKKKINKIAGADIHEFLLNDLNKKGGRCFHLGSSQGALDKIEERIAKEYPAIIFNSFSPPYKDSFSSIENNQMLEAVNNFQPDVLFVGMTAPKQEKWAFQHKEQLNTKIICSIGAVFDFYAGTVDRPSSFWIKLQLEWFIRLIKEPKRMWKRYLYYGPIFIKMMVAAKIKQVLKR